MTLSSIQLNSERFRQVNFAVFACVHVLFCTLSRLSLKFILSEPWRCCMALKNCRMSF
ncbi:hypothetical protein [Rickettsia endosymbiont of Ceutorhynchus obstrictus]|uniref:hypothetical protein n=1 Tax=Rickettsia endosymbiont of Ceutorhynchus obstrictus TaxID=3066249 RepID=UPI0031334F7C